MSVWKVYSKDGGIERCVLHAVEYGGTYMGERAVTATLTSHCEVEFGVFDYIIYRGEKFEIEAIPTVKKVSSFEYIYELRFVSLKYELERCEMRDLVPYDNDVVYPTPLTFSFTGNVRYLTERIQACLDSLYGDGVWNIVVDDGVRYLSEVLIQKKIIYARVLLCKNAGAHRRMADKLFHLFRGKMPKTVYFFALEYSGGNVIADRSVS
jgi:hypothetical protein